jgi:hypothetical protein
MTEQDKIKKWNAYLDGLTENEKATPAQCLENQAGWLLTSNESGVDPHIVLSAVAATLKLMRGKYEAALLPAFIGKDNNAHVVMSIRISNKISHLFQNLANNPAQADIGLFAKSLCEEYFLASPDRLLYLYTPLCIYSLPLNDSNQRFGLAYRGVFV